MKIEPIININTESSSSSINIHFMLDMPREVCLSLYNSNGHKIETLLNGIIDAGQHNVLWMNKEELQGMVYLNMQSGRCVKMKTIILSAD